MRVGLVLARGDRRLGAALKTAHEMGGARAFFRAMKACALTAEFYIRQKWRNRLLL